MSTKINNKTAPITDTSVPISGNFRKPCGLDWAESSWIRWIYVVFWTWLNPILNIGYKRQLTEDDLFELSPNDECRQLLNKIERVLKEEETKSESIHIWKIIMKTFWKEALMTALPFIPFIGVRIAQPLFLKELVNNISDKNSPSYIGYLYAVGIGLAIFLQAVLQHQLWFRTTRIGTHVRIAVSSIIYQRLLSLPMTAMLTTTTGQMINLISNDVSKFEELGINFQLIWEAPLEAIIVFGLIWNEIGIPTLFGYSILLLLVPLQLFFSKRFGAYRKNTVEWTDKRLKVVNEILVGCQIVKMYRWEESLQDVVYSARKNEFTSIRKASRIRSTNMGIFFASLSLISLATFGGSWLMGQELSSANVFMILTLFTTVRHPLTKGLPDAIEKLSESMIASKRINQILNLSKQFHGKSSHIDDNNDDHMLGSILMDKASFTWDINQSIQLFDIDLNIQNGSLVGIIGPIGSCKSSLLAAILGEMSLVQGYTKINGQISYVSQTAWIFAGTVRENILFYKPYDEEKYERILKASCLNADIHTFSSGDSTIIGEKGVNLSGGQRARISLARALYANADIYLFDDPLAAVDSTVAKKIFRRAIGNEGILKDKTRILVTHQLHFLPEFDHCIMLDDGKIEKQGSFTDLLTTDKIKEFYENEQYHLNDKKEPHQRHISDASVYDNIKHNELIDENSIIKEETSFRGTVSARVWLNLFTSSYGWFGLLSLIFLLLLGEAVYDATNKWLSQWSSKSKTAQRETYNIYVYLGLVIGTWIIALIRADYFFHLILSGASKLHNRMFKGVLFSSLRFYESNPVGRVLNRFSKDQQVIDELLPTTFFDTIQTLVMVLGSIVIIGITNPYVLIILVFIIPLFLWLRRFYLRTTTVLKRLESSTRSHIYALFSSSLSGLMTIRAFNMENNFVDLFIDKVNANMRILFIFHSAARWFSFRLDLMTGCLTFVTAILSVALNNIIGDPSSVALGLSYCISITALFQWGVRQSAETEIFMTSAERIDEYSQIPPESDFYTGESHPPVNWPSEGEIEFKNYKLRYREELEPVLKGLNLKIVPGNKIGIIGRTGAGKSSIFQALFRLTEKTTVDGQVLIDGIDIGTLSLSNVRTVLNIIPQFPVLFSNTLRYNLDPFRYYTDEQLWDSLEAVQLKAKIEKLNDQLNTQIAEYGSNFSVGECQLICIARAILKPSKILLIDEATAHVDTNTDQLIQQILREKFSNQTIITIAHRLNTIMDSDKIVVMSNGVVAEYGTPTEILKKQNHFNEDSNNNDNHISND